ncbi:MAG: hypothetical protein JXA15_04565 [Spirochaetales bacterium]|nr:hypothetical protein [Spirochaetales bacterium]
MRRSRLYFIGAVIEAARYFVFARLASELLGVEPGASRGLLHAIAPQLLVAGGLAALSHDPAKYEPLRPFLAVAKVLSVATALFVMPGLGGAAYSVGASLGPGALLAGFGAIAVWDLSLGALLAFSRSGTDAASGRSRGAGTLMEEIETVPAADGPGAGGESD